MGVNSRGSPKGVDDFGFILKLKDKNEGIKINILNETESVLPKQSEQVEFSLIVDQDNNPVNLQDVQKNPFFQGKIKFGEEWLNVERLGVNSNGSAKAAGAFGFILRVKDRNEVIKVNIICKNKDIEDFRNEIKIALIMEDSSFVLGAKDAILTKEVSFIRMDFLEGGSLNEKITKGFLTTEEKIKYATQAILGIKEMHDKGIIHKDLKPANMMLDSKDNLHIVDFGLSRIIKEEEKDTRYAGSPKYMAPEVVYEHINLGKFSKEEKEALDKAYKAGFSTPVDIYSYGVFLTDLLGGIMIPDFRSISPERFQKLQNLERPICTLVLENQYIFDIARNCLQINPELRPTANEIAEKLQNFYNIKNSNLEFS